MRRLTAEGLSVLLLHHPRKDPGTNGECARGSGGLSGFIDVLLEMHWCGQAESEDHRRILAWSRHVTYNGRGLTPFYLSKLG